MIVVLVLAGMAVLGAVVLLAMGRGGELAETHPDYPRLPLGADGRTITGPDVARMRFPRTFWGYQPHVMDEALRRVTHALSERDARVAVLEHQLYELRHGSGSIGALHGLEDPTVLDEPPTNGDAPPSLTKAETDVEREDEPVGPATEERP
ncbi:MAG: hypothetical protein ACRDNL_06620 [Spirillospora sp.]